MDAIAELSTEDLPRLLAALAAMPAASDDSERIDRIRHFEQLKAALCAAQVVEVAEFDASQRAVQETDGVPVARRGRGVGLQVAFAMRVSHHAGQRFTSYARIVQAELPATFAQLRAGRISEWKAMLVARETAVLSRADRAVVDADLAPRLEAWGARQVDAEARKAAYRLDPHAATARAIRAREARRVTCRPVPDTMARLSAELPVEHAIACLAALTKHADTLIGTGHADGRNRSQLMADTLVQRLTAHTTASSAPGDAGAPGGPVAVPVEIQLVMTDTSLLAPTGTPGHDDPALIPGYGWLPAPLARAIALNNDHSLTSDDTSRGQRERQPGRQRRRSRGRQRPAAPRWLRKLYRHPETGQLVAMDSRRRCFTPSQQRFITTRDQTCRNPYCGAPIRHIDHIQPWANGGMTSISNAQGYCAACNHAIQAAGWTTTTLTDESISVRTPTGHNYLSRPPDPPGHHTPTLADNDPGGSAIIGHLITINDLAA